MATQRDKEFMRRAIELSRKAGILDRVGNCFGCVIVKDDEIVSEGYNQVRSRFVPLWQTLISVFWVESVVLQVFLRNDPTWHAEMHAIREGCSARGSPSLKGCTMYTSTVPCPMCTGAIYWSRIDKVFYGASNEDVSRAKGFETDVNVFEGDDYKKAPQDRTLIPFVQLMQTEAADVFEEFRSLPDDHQRHY
eukprot:jgi/Botrbrau1/16171/Bobra.0272s0006.1